jgi:uncharacterized repeat protein (TIGR04076 family)
MAHDPGIGQEIMATIVDVNGNCSAGHQKGERFAISCYNSGELCGFFYHDIFPSLSTFQFGGSMPWWKGDTIQLKCPDPVNVVTIELHRTQRS